MDRPEEAAAYAAADFADVNAAFVARLLELAGSHVQARVVDLGCGPADIPIRLIRARPTWTVVAVDGSEAMLALALAAVESAELRHAIEFVRADAKATGLPGQSFDVVCSNSILHHVADPVRFWTEVRRLGRPGAIVFMRDLCRPESDNVARELVAKHAGNESPLLQREFFESLLSAYTVDEVRDQLAGKMPTDFVVSKVTDRHLDVIGVLP
jgi:ubiquinone/menaquinone biosynthesis C-methylase UbiE